MRLHGWCERCHKIRLVTVRVPRPGAVQVGICDDCEQAGQARRRK
jgi:hypothetical protein